MKQPYTFEQKKPLLLTLLGYTMVFLGLFLTIFENIFFAIFVGLGIRVLLVNGIAINSVTRSQRDYTKIFGFTFGKWEPFPKPEYLTVLRAKASGRVYMTSASVRVEEEYYKINLFYSENEHIEIYKGEDEQGAYKTALELAKEFETDLYDSLSEEWIYTHNA